MNNGISPTQQRYLAALLPSIGQTRFKELKKQLKISQTSSVSDLSKDEAFQLITKIIAEVSSVAVEQALAVALREEAA